MTAPADFSVPTFLSIDRVQFNNSWFVFHDSSLSFHGPYFSRNKNFMNHLGWTEYKIMVLKPANKSKTIGQCHNFWKDFYQRFPSSSNSLSSKGFVNILFYGDNLWKQLSDKTRQLTTQAFIYYLIYSETFFVKSCNTRKLDMSSSMEIHHFKK